MSLNPADIGSGFGVGAIAVGVVGWLANRRKTKAEAADIITQAAAGAVKLLEGQLSQLNQHVRTCESALDKARADLASALDALTAAREEIDTLRARVVELERRLAELRAAEGDGR